MKSRSFLYTPGELGGKMLWLKFIIRKKSNYVIRLFEMWGKNQVMHIDSIFYDASF